MARKRGFGWDAHDSGDALDRMLGPMALTAAELLTSAALEDTRECGVLTLLFTRPRALDLPLTVEACRTTK